jgi:hypothetical protein
LWSALSDRRTCLSFVYAAGPCQRSLSWVRVPWDSQPYFTISDLRLPFSSPPTTRRVTVEIFDPVSTRVLPCYICNWRYIASARTTQKTVSLLLQRSVYRMIAQQQSLRWSHRKPVTWSLPLLRNLATDCLPPMTAQTSFYTDISYSCQQSPDHLCSTQVKQL